MDYSASVSDLVNLQADANSDPNNWTFDWHEGWDKAGQDWQRVSAEWYGQSQKTIDESFSLELFPDLPAGSPRTILVRRCYQQIFPCIWERALIFRGSGAGILITGHPGTGKTLFLPYLLARLLQLNQSVLFSLDGERLYLFYFGHVWTATADSNLSLPTRAHTSTPVFIWSLFDVKVEPGDPLVWNTCYPIQTNSLDRSRYKRWFKERGPDITGFPLWTREELVKGLYHQSRHPALLMALKLSYEGSSKERLLCQFPGTSELLEEQFQDKLPHSSPQDAVEYLLDAAIEHFGYAPGDVYEGIFQFQQHTSDHNLKHMSPERLQKFALTLAVELGSTEEPETSGRIFALFPVRRRRNYVTAVDWKVEFKSAWVAKQFVDLLEAADDDAVRKQISLFKRIPETNGIVAFLAEPFIHRMLADAATKDLWALKATFYEDIDEPTVKNLGTPAPSEEFFAQVKRPIHRIHDLPQYLASGVYYWPYATYYPFFDAFTIEIKGNSAVLWILQLTTSLSHQGSGSFYRKVHDIVQKLKTQMRDQMPPIQAQKADSGRGAAEPSVEVRYVLVVQKGGDEELRWTFPKGWKDCCMTNDHRGKSYCLELPLSFF